MRRPISRSASRTASQVFFTAPPVMYVCREADVEPAEPTWVSAGWMVTCVTPSSVRAICVWTVMPPWPTSAMAVWTIATGSPLMTSSRTRAVE